MRKYDRINAVSPLGIETKRAHIIGGGIAGLAAAFLSQSYRARPEPLGNPPERELPLQH